MRRLPHEAATGAIACVLFLLLTGPIHDQAVAATGSVATARADALKTAGDLRTRLERNAQAAPLSRLKQTMKSVTSSRELNGYGMTLFLKNMPMNALVVLTEAARRSPDDFLPFNNLGAILNNFGQYEMALILLRYADELSPDNAMVLSNLGVTELGRRREKEAEGFFLKALAQAPNHPEANYALGTLSARRSDAQAAERYLNRSLEGAFTEKAAQALRSLDRESRRAARKQDAGTRRRAPAQPPPVPARASKEDNELRLVLPEIEAESLSDFYGAWRTYKAEADTAQPIGAAIALELKELTGRLNQSRSTASTRPERTVILLGDGKAKRGFENASQWYASLADLNENHGDYVVSTIKELAEISAEQAGIFRAEEAKCRQIKDSRARDACEKEVRKRACGRYFEAFEPLFLDYRKAHEEFAPRWQAAATSYVQTADYWASYFRDPLEAKRRRLSARLLVSGQFLGITSNLAGNSNAFGPPNGDCFEMPKPAAPTGELRLEEFIVPCSFPGIDLSFDGASVSIDCTSVTIGGELGPAIGELEWNFVEKTGTIFLGVGGEIEAGQIIKVGASARVGFELCFDREGFTDIRMSGQTEMGASWDLPGRSIDIVKAGGVGDVGLNSAPSFSRTLPPLP